MPSSLTRSLARSGCSLLPTLVVQRLPFTANPRTVYRGLGASASAQALITGTQFITTGAVKRVLTGGEQRRLSDAETVGAALVGGAISGLICGPLELLMIQQQLHGGSLAATARRLASGPGTFFQKTR